MTKLFLAAGLLLVPIALAQPQDGRALIPEGTAIMGTDKKDIPAQVGADRRINPQWYSDETPVRKVAVGSFYIDITEVTNKRYRSLIPGHRYPENLENHPVVNVTWKEADEFCRKAGGRLPTEVEWERAARGDAGYVYPWGNTFVPGNAVFMDTAGGGKGKVKAWSQEESGENILGGTHPVASIEAGKSPFGLYDMAGNAWEWVDGWYDKDNKLRLLKGGSWLSPKESLRSAARLPEVEGERRFNDFGFRCAYGLKKGAN